MEQFSTVRAESTALDEILRVPFLAPPLQPPPVFVIGNRRSGTTLLSWFLDSHPEIAAIPETWLCRSFLDSGPIIGLATNSPGPLTVAAAALRQLNGDHRKFNSRMASIIHEVYVDYAVRCGKARWIAKEVFVPDRLDLLDSLFNYEARFIYIFRHGIDCAYSISKKFGPFGGGPAPTGMRLFNYLHQWKTSNDMAMDFADRNIGRTYLIKYEDFVAHPEAIGKQLTAFLGVQWPPTILSDMWNQQHHPGLGANSAQDMGRGFDTSRMNQWQNWPKPLVRQLGAIANPTLIRLGYPAI